MAATKTKETHKRPSIVLAAAIIIAVAALVVIAVVLAPMIADGLQTRTAPLIEEPEATTPVVSEWEIENGVASNRWKDITAATKMDPDVDLKARFLDGFMWEEGETTYFDAETFAEAHKAILGSTMSVEDLAGQALAEDKFAEFSEYINSEPLTITVKLVTNQELQQMTNSGLVKIRPEGDFNTLVWQVIVRQPDNNGGWQPSRPVVYDDRSSTESALNVLVYGLDPALSDEQVTWQIIDHSQDRPDALAIFYFGAFGIELDISTLVVDYAAFTNRQPTYMSAAGEAAQVELRDALLDALRAGNYDRRALTAEEIAYLFNTGSNGTAYSRAYSQGIVADNTMAMIYHLKNKRDFYVLFKCGNVLLPPGTPIPPGPTPDQPIPPDDPVPPPVDPKDYSWSSGYTGAATVGTGAGHNDVPGVGTPTPAPNPGTATGGGSGSGSGGGGNAYQPPIPGGDPVITPEPNAPPPSNPGQGDGSQIPSPSRG